jgi:hypothetical protein
MTADEALAIVESMLDQDGLNDVQELIFKECWNGNHSYKDIAHKYLYDDEYIRVVASQLWDKLTKVFGKKVRRNKLHSVINGHQRHKQFNIQRDLTIEVGSDSKVFTGINEVEYCEKNIYKNNQNNQNKSVNIIDDWDDFKLNSLAQIKIANALENQGIFFIPNPHIRYAKHTQKVDFFISYHGKSGIINIVDEENKDTLDNIDAVSVIKYYHSDRCLQEPDQVVQEFLELLE